MSKLYPSIDPEGLVEYSVVYTDRSLNHMSQSFQGVMKNISRTLKQVYNAQAVAVVPGSGTFGMEAVARQFATGQQCLVIRNGWFSYRWSQILEMGNIPAATTVLKARPIDTGRQAAYAPPPLDEVLAAIEAHKPQVVFAPHVETSSGMILPDDYLRAVGDAVHAVGGLFVLDCIASGTLWVDMQKCAVDLLISAPPERLERLPLLRPGDVQCLGPGAHRADAEQQLCLQPAKVAADHAGLRTGRACLPCDHAQRFTGALQ